jgi:Domain of unknown function (DUF5664)
VKTLIEKVQKELKPEEMNSDGFNGQGLRNENELKITGAVRCSGHGEQHTNYEGRCLICIEEDSSDRLSRPKRGNKNDQGKPKLALIPPVALREMGKAFSGRDSNIEQWNYKYGIETTRTLSGALRHLCDALEGIDVDPGTGAHSLGCAMANIAMALDTIYNHPDMDDRWKRGKT